MVGRRSLVFVLVVTSMSLGGAAASASPVYFGDPDQDGVVENNDPCPGVFNPPSEGWLDIDSDTITDACDPSVDYGHPGGGQILVVVHLRDQNGDVVLSMTCYDRDGIVHTPNGDQQINDNICDSHGYALLEVGGGVNSAEGTFTITQPPPGCDGVGTTQTYDTADPPGTGVGRYLFLMTFICADTDGDGLTDPGEVKWFTDPADPDSDGDGLTDGLEAHGDGGSLSDPFLADTDSDGFNDGDEVAAGTDPADPAQVPTTPHFAVGDVSLGEGNAGTKNLKFVVTLSPAASATTRVKVQTQDGSATAGSDYTALALKTLTYQPGVTSKNVIVVLNGDVAFEPNETFTLELSDATGGAFIADPTGLATILNDDDPASCTISGTAAANVLNGTNGPDVICGLGGNDTINGVGGNDILLGGAGNDILVGGPGDDDLTGGSGNDTASYADAGSTSVSVSLLVVGSPQTTGAATGADTFSDQIERLTGGGGADSLTGSAGPNTLKGGTGNDQLFGGAGVDSLLGQGGNDALDGGADAPDSCNGGGGGGDSAVGCESISGIP
jgi:Ca2+-binding RTX toxin-like protein